MVVPCFLCDPVYDARTCIFYLIFPPRIPTSTIICYGAYNLKQLSMNYESVPKGIELSRQEKCVF